MTKAKTTRGGKRGAGSMTVKMLAFGIVFFLYALLFPLYRTFDYLLACALSLGVSGAVTALLRNLPHSRLAQEETVAAIPLSGNPAVDELTRKGQEMVAQIRLENDLISDTDLSAQMDELERLCGKILRVVAEKPSKASQIRRFMSYYMPTTLKMLKGYRTLDDAAASGGAAREAQERIATAMDMVIAACKKQLDTLYYDDILDITTDIAVLEQVLKRDGLSGAGFPSFTEGDNDENHETGGVPYE